VMEFSLELKERQKYINEVLDAAERLCGNGVSAEIIKLNRLDCPDYELLHTSVKKTGRLLIVEESAYEGSVGVRILAELALRGTAVKSKLINLGSGVVEHGSAAQLRNKLGMDADGILAACGEMLK